jgi:predicted Zn-dependent protease
MGMFRKPIRALDRLPSRFRPAKAAPVAPDRADAFKRAPEPAAPVGFRGPGNAVTLLIFMLSVTLLTAIIVLWKTGSGGPQHANGASISHGRVASAESVSALLGAAKAFADQHDFAKAEAILRAAVHEHDSDQELRIALAETLVRQRKKAEAYDQYARALEIGPSEPRLEFVAGTLASETGRLAQAAVHYSAAQAGDPTNAQYPLYLALIQSKQDKLEDAKINLLYAVNLDPNSAIAWGTLGDIFLRQNKLDLAITNVGKARELQPEAAVWKLVEARALARKGDPQRALLVLSTLDTSQQREPNTLSLMAQCYGLLKRPSEAARLYVDASDASPADAELAYHAGTWAYRAGEKSTAQKYAQHAHRLGHKGAQDLLARIRK